MKTEKKAFKFFWLVGSIFVAILLIANTVGGKLFTLGSLVLPGGVVVFPISYIFGDVLTEVYGYGASRKIIWTGLGCLVLMSLVYLGVQALPPAPFWPHQTSYEAVLGFAPRIALASSVAYFVGEFSNSYTLARMKIWTKGRHLWARTIGSTVVGEGADTIVFVAIAFVGVHPLSALVTVVFSNYAVKVAYEVLATPLTYYVVARLKKSEGVDVFDRGTNFNPFIIAR